MDDSPADLAALTEKAEGYLRTLCEDLPGRHVGSEGNRRATDFFAAAASSFGFETETPAFECIDWRGEGARLEAGGATFEAFPSPYALGCRVTAPLAVVSTVAELDGADLSGCVVLLRGDLAREQLMPKNFPFYNPERHRRIVGLLETKGPSAVVAATSRDVEMVGATYPFPLVEDGDFGIPAVHMTEEEGRRLARHAGADVALESRAERIPSTGCNVVARRGGASGRRVVLFAHIDAKQGTPGALDDAAGVATLLLLAELLQHDDAAPAVEMVAVNGEDYFSAPGEQLYLAQADFDGVMLGVNLDGLGYREGRDAYSLYDCPPGLAETVHAAFAAYDGLMEGPRWYQGDHGLFLMNGVPAVAVTSERIEELMREVIHTTADRPEIVDAARLADVARALRDLVRVLAPT